MELAILGLIVVASILMIPFGLPGTWIIAASALGYRILVPQGGVGYFTVVAMAVLAIVSAVIDMGKNLHQRVIAEGVEDEAQLAFLKIHKCSEGQGFLFSRPLNAMRMEAMLNNGIVA